MSESKRLGVVGIVVEDPSKAPEINHILSQYSEIIIGRMGIPHIPHNDSGVNVISIIVHGTNDVIGAMTGKIGSIKNVQVKAALSSK